MSEAEFTPEEMAILEAEAAKHRTPEPDPFQMELRGYEVARLSRGRWVKVGSYCATQYGLREALHSAAWLNERHEGETYSVRPVVSMLPPQPKRDNEEAPLFLDEDEPVDVPEDVQLAIAQEIMEERAEALAKLGE